MTVLASSAAHAPSTMKLCGARSSHASVAPASESARGRASPTAPASPASPNAPSAPASITIGVESPVNGSQLAAAASGVPAMISVRSDRRTTAEASRAGASRAIDMIGHGGRSAPARW